MRLHDLRHSAASDTVAAGVPIALIGALLGHKHPQTTQRHAHVNDAALRGAACTMGEAIERSTREGAERLQRRRAIGDDKGPTGASDRGDIMPTDGGKVLRFPGRRRRD